MSYLTKKQKDSLFKAIKPVNSKLLKQIDDEMLLQSGYLFKECKNKTAYCTCCKKRFSLDGVTHNGLLIRQAKPQLYMRHNESTYCPNCEKPVVIKESGRGRSQLADIAYVAILQKLKNQTIVLRSFCIMKDYSKNYENVETQYSEHYRIYYKPGEVHAFKRRNVSYTWLSRNDYYNDYSKPYTSFEEMRNLPKRITYPTGIGGWYYLEAKDINQYAEYFGTDVVEQSKFFTYSCFEKFVNECPDDVVLHKYLEFYCKHPVLAERLVKEGFTDLLSWILGCKGPKSLNYKSNTVKGFFKMDGSEIKELLKLNDYCALQIKEYGLPVNKDSLNYVKREYHSAAEIKSFLTTNNLPCEFEDIMKYLVKQKTDFSMYGDYVRWLIKYNLPINKKTLFPRYFKQEHDKMMEYNKRCEEIRKEKEDKKKMKNFESKILPYLKTVFEFSNDNFMIRPFYDGKEIINEGQIQNICVGQENYRNSYIAGNTYLFCMRRISAPDTPFVTIEVRPNGTLIQSRAERNASPPEDAKAFINEWQMFYKKNLKRQPKREVA